MKYRRKEPLTKEDIPVRFGGSLGYLEELARVTCRYGLKLMRHGGEFICVRSTDKKHKDTSEKTVSLLRRKWG